MSRVPLVAGNWKMHGTRAEAEALIRRLLALLEGVEGVEVVVCVPFTALAPVVAATREAPVRVFAQTMHEEERGAFTGEVSAPMLTEIGVEGVVLGHSERRLLFGETHRRLQAKVPAALDHGLTPILCVGETEEERARGETESRLRHQVTEDLARVPSERLAEVVVAYEPVWAIGTGQRATPEQAQEACAFVRGLLAERSPAAAEAVRVLYGGSVKGDSAGELLALPDVDGALVGGASLDADDFATIVKAAAR